MYKLLRYNKRFNSKLFDSYEQARQYLRKWMRKNFSISGHPPLDVGGFSITKI